MMSEVNFGNDGDYSHRAMIYKVNANLANELGNLCQRTLSLVFKNCNKQIPVPGEFTEADKELLQAAENLYDTAANHIAFQAIQKYVDTMIGIGVQANKYIDTQEPWVLRKTDPDRMATVLYVLMEVIRYAAILYQPVIPTASRKILDQLAVKPDQRDFAHLTKEFRISPGSPIEKPVGVFPRIEVPQELLATS